MKCDGADVHFIRSTVTNEAGRDQIDTGIDDIIVVDPYNGDPPSRRKDEDLSRLLSILDSIDERGTSAP